MMRYYLNVHFQGQRVNGGLQRELSVVWNNRMHIQQNQQHYSPVPQCSSDVRANQPRKTPSPNQTIATSNTNYKNLSTALKGCAFIHKRESWPECQHSVRSDNVIYMRNLVLYINKVCYKSCGYSWLADAETPSRSILLSLTVRWSLDVFIYTVYLRFKGPQFTPDVNHEIVPFPHDLLSKLNGYTQRTGNLRDLIQFTGIR